MKITPNRIANADEIVSLAEACTPLFMDYPEGVPSRLFDPYRDAYDQQDDRFHVLRMGYNMPRDLEDLIVRSLNLSERDRRTDIRIHRYDTGDYLQPRRDPGRKGIVVLTSSDRDGMTVTDSSGQVRRVADVAGTYVVTEPDTWHWIDPVRGAPRYTIVGDAPFHGPSPVNDGGHGRPRRSGAAKRASRRPATTEILARGSTSVVYETADPDVVLKTCWRTAAYDAFLKVARDFPSPHLPVVHDMASNPDGRQWIAMERLAPLAGDDPLWSVVNAFADYCHAAYDDRRVAMPEALTVELAALAEVLGAKARHYGHFLDLYRANIMVRPQTAEIVVVDPYR